MITILTSSNYIKFINIIKKTIPKNFIIYNQVKPDDSKYSNVKHEVARYISNEPSIDEYSERTDNKLLDFFIIDILNKLYLPSLNKRINHKIVTYDIQNDDESKIREKLRKRNCKVSIQC